MITSDKCYENIEKRSGYKEIDRIGGIDPYSASKASAEIAIKSYFESFIVKTNHRIASARAGNVIGGGDWNYGRIIPDCRNALKEKKEEYFATLPIKDGSMPKPAGRKSDNIKPGFNIWNNNITG